MGFSAKQLAALRRELNPRQVRSREAHGRHFSYLEGWYVISEANRIFGYDGWSRETVESRCVLARENRGNFVAIYVARVRISVKAHGLTVIREGSGSGEGRGASPADVHDIALKAAETDATKRALSTFGKPFGLELYRSDKPTSPSAALIRNQPVTAEEVPTLAALAAIQHPVITPTRTGSHPDDTTPIPRPSRYHGRRHDRPLAQQLANARTPVGQRQDASPSVSEGDGRRKPAPKYPVAPTAPPLVPVAPQVAPAASGRIDKSALTIAEPKRLRDKAHLKFVASEPCVVCGRQPCDPHHLRFAQPRAIGLKVSDEFTVPLCRGHHQQLHQAGNEPLWWENYKIDPLKPAKELWEKTHPHTVITKEKT